MRSTSPPPSGPSRLLPGPGPQPPAPVACPGPAPGRPRPRPPRAARPRRTARAPPVRAGRPAGRRRSSRTASRGRGRAPRAQPGAPRRSHHSTAVVQSLPRNARAHPASGLPQTSGRSWIDPRAARVTWTASGWPRGAVRVSAVICSSARCHSGTSARRLTVRMCHSSAGPVLAVEPDRARAGRADRAGVRVVPGNGLVSAIRGPAHLCLDQAAAGSRPGDDAPHTALPDVLLAAGEGHLAELLDQPALTQLVHPARVRRPAHSNPTGPLPGQPPEHGRHDGDGRGAGQSHRGCDQRVGVDEHEQEDAGEGR